MLTEPIVEGAWYRCKNQRIVGPAQWEDARRKGWWVINGVSYDSKGRASDLYPEAPDLECRVYFVPVDPAEVVVELQRLGDEEIRGETKEAFYDAADLVATKLGVKP